MFPDRGESSRIPRPQPMDPTARGQIVMMAAAMGAKQHVQQGHLQAAGAPSVRPRPPVNAHQFTDDDSSEASLMSPGQSGGSRATKATSRPLKNAPEVGGEEADETLSETVRTKKKLLNGTSIEYVYPSGSVYRGGFKDGKLSGYGRYMYKPSGDMYEGEWMVDVKHGRGTYTYANTDRYTGEWHMGKKQGKGTYSFTSGDEYTGSWANDKIEGYGVFRIASNGNRYEGNWTDSYRHGHGILYSGNGDQYDGEWARGKEEGIGVLMFANRDLFCGEWKNGQMDGRGILREAGSVFAVEYVAGYLISKVALSKNQEPEPPWMPVYKAYLRYITKERDIAKVEAKGNDGAEIMKLKMEVDLLQRKYDEVLKDKSLDSTKKARTSIDFASMSESDSQTIAELRKVIEELERRIEVDQLRAQELEAAVQKLTADLSESEYGRARLEEEMMLIRHDRNPSNFFSDEGDPQVELGANEVVSALIGQSPSPNAATSELQDLQKKVEELTEERQAIKAVREESSELRNNNTELMRANADLLRRVATLQSRNGILEREANDVRAKTSHGFDNITSHALYIALVDENKGIVQENRELQAKAASLEVVSTELEDARANLAALLQKEFVSSKEHAEEVARLKQGTEAAIAELEKKFAAAQDISTDPMYVATRQESAERVKEIDVLKHKLEAAESRVAEEIARHKKHEEKVTHLQQASEAAIAQLEKKFAAAQDITADPMYVAARQESAEMVKSMQTLRQKLEAAESKVADYTVTQSNLESTAAAELALAQSEVTAAVAHQQALEQKIESKNSELQAIQASLKDAEERIAASETARAEQCNALRTSAELAAAEERKSFDTLISQSRADHAAEIERLKGRIAELEDVTTNGTYLALSAENKDLASDNERLQKKLQALEATSKELKSVHEQLTLQKATAESGSKELTTALQCLETQSQELVKVKAAHVELEAAHQSIVKEKTERLGIVEAALQSAQMEAAKALECAKVAAAEAVSKTQVGHAATSVNLERRIAELEAQLAARIAENEDLVSKMAELTAEVRLHRIKASSLEKQIAGAASDGGDAGKQLLQLADENAELKETLDENEAQRKRLASDLLNREKKCAELETEIVRLVRTKTLDPVILASLDRKMDQMAQLQVKNAELARLLEELQMEGDIKKSKKRDKRRDNEEKIKTPRRGAVAEIEQLEKELKKEQRRHKKAAADRDVLAQDLYEEQVKHARVDRTLQNAHGRFTIVAKVRPLLKRDGKGGKKDDTVAVYVNKMDVSQIIVSDGSAMNTSVVSSGDAGGSAPGGGTPFQLDYCADASTGWEDLFNEIKSPLAFVKEGFQVAYVTCGSRGSGKTTMFMGLLPLILGELEHQIDKRQTSNSTVTVSVSVVEVGAFGCIDCASGGPIPEILRDAKGFILPNGATFVSCGPAQDVTGNRALRGRRGTVACDTLLSLITKLCGQRQQKNGRSHLWVQIRVCAQHTVHRTSFTGRLTLVDLCGGGSLGDQQSDLESGKFANRSEKCLDDVMTALESNAEGVPYTSSMEAMLLSDILGGSCMTTLLAALSPSLAEVNDSKRTLRFVQRGASAVNHPIVQDHMDRDAVRCHDKLKETFGEFDVSTEPLLVDV